MSHDPELPPPGLFDPIMDEESLLCPSDPYPFPPRSPEEWMCGDELWHPERVAMYDYAKQQLQEQGSTERQSEIAVMIAKSFNSAQMGRQLRLPQDTISGLIRDLYGYDLRHPFRAIVTNQVVWAGMRQIILHSLNELFPKSRSEELFDRSGRILSQRFQRRVESFRFSPREIEMTHMLFSGKTHAEIGQKTQLTQETVGQYVYSAYTKANCHGRIQLVHRMYGA